MDMIRIKRLSEISESELNRLVAGYTSDARFAVEKHESVDELGIRLRLETLPAPYVKEYDSVGAKTLEIYAAAVKEGLSVGAFDGKRLVGLGLVEKRKWNSSLWVWEFHVDGRYQRQGIGRRMMERLVLNARAAGLSRIVCETQNSNVPAIRFFRSLGFKMEGIDVTLYSNEDYPDGEMGIFMKRRV